MSNRPRRRTVLSGLATAGLGGLAGCSGDLPNLRSTQPDDELGGTDRTLRVAVLMPLSGDLSGPGAVIRDAAILPETQLRNEDAPFEFDVGEFDTETSEGAGVQAAAEIVDQGYPAVTGAAASGVTIQATKQVLIPYRVMSCSPASTSPTITALNDTGLVYRTIPSDALQGVVLAERAANDVGSSTAATLYVDNDYGYQLSRSFERAFTVEHGGEVTAQVPYEEELDSYVDELDAARADDPDLLVVVGYPDSGVQIFDDFYETGGEQDVLVTDGLQNPEFAQDVEHSLDGVRGTAPTAAGPGSEFFASQFEDEYGDPPGIYAAQGYDATALLLLANAYAGQNDGTAIRSAMRQVANPDGEEITPESLADGLELAAAGQNVNYQGASSVVTFDDNGDITEATYEYWEFDESADGGIAVVEEVST